MAITTPPPTPPSTATTPPMIGHHHRHRHRHYRHRRQEQRISEHDHPYHALGEEEASNLAAFAEITKLEAFLDDPSDLRFKLRADNSNRRYHHRESLITTRNNTANDNANDNDNDNANTYLASPLPSHLATALLPHPGMDMPPHTSGLSFVSQDAATTFPSAIKINTFDKDEAFDRLLHDLSQDEVLVLVDIFGKGSPANAKQLQKPKQQQQQQQQHQQQYQQQHQQHHIEVEEDFGAAPLDPDKLKHDVDRDCASIQVIPLPLPLSLPPPLPSPSFSKEGTRALCISPSSAPAPAAQLGDEKQSIITTLSSRPTRRNSSDTKIIMPQPLPRCLFNHHPMRLEGLRSFERLGFDTNGMLLLDDQKNGVAQSMPSHHHQAGAIATSTASLLVQKANDSISHRTVSPMLGALLPATAAKEQQMAKKRSKKKQELLHSMSSMSMLIDIAPHKRPHDDDAATAADSLLPSLVSAPPLKKRALSGYKCPQENISIGSCTTATTTTGTRVAPVNKKKKKSVTKKKKNVTVSKKQNNSTVTYITHPSKTDDNRWKRRLSEAKAFIQEHGHGRIPTNFPSNPDLASWAKRQRYHYKIYQTHFLENDAYCKNGSNANKSNPTTATATATVTATTVTTSSPSLSATTTVHNAIAAHLIKKENPKVNVVKCLMTADRLKTLKEIGFCLNLQVGLWEVNYELLQKFAKRNYGNTSISKHVHHDLWKWVGTQRYQMTLWKRGDYRTYMTPGRIFKLNAINFVWEETKSDSV